MRIGFVGTGTITAHIVRGLKASPLADWPVLLSPRSHEVAQALAADLSGVAIAADNQQVVSRADVVVLAVRPQQAEAVIRPLIFDPARPVISLIATLPIARLRDWTGAAHICRAIPLPFVENRKGVTPVMPPEPEAMQLFGVLGQALPAHDIATFDSYAAASALMGSWFGLVETAADWMQAQGVAEGDARAYLRALFGSLGETLATSPLSPAALRQAHSTAGGLNEQLHAVFQARGGAAAVTAGLSAVLARISAG